MFLALHVLTLCLFMAARAQWPAQAIAAQETVEIGGAGGGTTSRPHRASPVAF